MRHIRSHCLTLLMLMSVVLPVRAAETMTIGSKNFSEQFILSEIAAQLIEKHTDLEVTRQFGLSGTGVCHEALVQGELDLYVEYTGTALLNVLKHEVVTDSDEAFRIVAEAYREQFELHWLPPIGFNNSYALATREKLARQNNWETISDMAADASELDAGFTGEFRERPDGYPGLKQVYGLEFNSIRDMEPGLMYPAAGEGDVDIVSAFITDARVAAYDLMILVDDKKFFPPYDAAPIVRGELLREHPEIRDALIAMAGTIDEETMRKLNYRVTEQKLQPSEVARQWIEARYDPTKSLELTSESPQQSARASFFSVAWERRGELAKKSLEHLVLVGLAMGLAILIGVPTGIAIYRYNAASNVVLGLAEIMQTIPSLAMLAFLFAFYSQLGLLPAVSALVLYALLPIVLNTFTGLKEVPQRLIEAADGVGMSQKQRLWMVELPLALPVIIAGIRTSTVWTVGIATLSTYIGAGGLGDFISRGLARSDTTLTLLGALPAAVIALVLSLMIRIIQARLSRG